MLRLGKLTLDVPFFQASLSGYSDYAMRKFARNFSCPLTFAGVMLAKSAAHPKVVKKPNFRPYPDEHPVGAQILGREPKIMAAAAKELVKVGYDLIDLNFACPAPKVLRRKRGGAILNEPDLAIDIFNAVRDAVDCPILMKLRKGFDNSPSAMDNFYKLVAKASENDVDALIIHDRTVKQKYRGLADWKIITDLKKQFPQTTIIASGDVFDAKKTFDLFKRSGLDGFLVARGAIGNPWLFKELAALCTDKEIPPPPDLQEQKQIILNHLDEILKLYHQRKAVGYFRKFLVNYLRRHPNRKSAQKTLMTIKNKDKLIEQIKIQYSEN